MTIKKEKLFASKLPCQPNLILSSLGLVHLAGNSPRATASLPDDGQTFIIYTSSVVPFSGDSQFFIHVADNFSLLFAKFVLRSLILFDYKPREKLY